MSNILSYSGPEVVCLVNRAELWLCIWDCRELSVSTFRVSLWRVTHCVIHWAAGSCFALWTMTNIMEEVLDLARHCVIHVKQAANEVADDLAKEGGSRQRYVIL